MPEPCLTLTQRKRSDIINACIAEFEEHGFAGARIDRIAERAKVSKRTLYKHFPSKEALFDAIMAIVFAPIQQNDKATLKPDSPLKDQLAELVETYVQAVSDDEYIALSRVIVSEFIRNPERSRIARAKASIASGPIERMIRQAMEAGLLRPADPAYAAVQLSALIKAFCFYPKFLNGEAPPDTIQSRNIIDDCIEMFLKHYQLQGSPSQDTQDTAGAGAAIGE